MATGANRYERYELTLGAVNGAIVVGLVVLLYAFFSGWGFYVEKLYLALPLGLITTWRAARFIRGVRTGTYTPFRGPLEGFVLLFGIAAIYLTFNIVVAHVNGADPQGWGRPFWSLFFRYVLFYGLIAGGAGALTGAVLESLNVLLIEMGSKRRAGVSSKHAAR